MKNELCILQPCLSPILYSPADTQTIHKKYDMSYFHCYQHWPPFLFYFGLLQYILHKAVRATFKKCEFYKKCLKPSNVSVIFRMKWISSQSFFVCMYKHVSTSLWTHVHGYESGGQSTEDEHIKYSYQVFQAIWRPFPLHFWLFSSSHFVREQRALRSLCWPSFFLTSFDKDLEEFCQMSCNHTHFWQTCSPNQSTFAKQQLFYSDEHQRKR